MKSIISKVFVVMAIVLAGRLSAATISSASSGAWSESSTWEGGVIPTENDDVVIKDGHTVHLDIVPNGSNSYSLCNALTVEQEGVIQLGYNGSNLDKKFVVSGDITIDGTVSAGRNVPADIYSGEGLIYEQSSSIILQLTQASTKLAGKGYFHPQNLIIQNESEERSLTIDHYNVMVEEDFYLNGESHINLLVDRYAYIRTKGSFNTIGKSYDEASVETSGDVTIKGIVFAGDVGLYTKNTTVSSSITLEDDGVLTANQINGDHNVSNASGGFSLTLNDHATMRIDEGVSNPTSLASNDPNLQVTTNGNLKLHFTETLTPTTELVSRVEAFDRSDYEQVRPMKEKIGASHIAGWYNFTDQPFLLEGKNRFKEWGSKTIKTTISANNGKMFEAYPFNHEWSTYAEPAEVIQHEYMDSLFSDPYFTTHAFWAPTKNVNGYYKNGADRNHDRFIETENQIYRAAKVFLEKYGHMEKTFLFQNWEGDWMLRGNNRQWEDNPETIPDDVDWQVEGMARLWRANMRGIERALEEFPDAVAKIQYAVEYNKLFRRVDGEYFTMMDLEVPCLIADVIPKVRMDMSSWSAYDGNWEENDRPYPTAYWHGLEIAAYYTNGNKELEGIPVMLGEIGMNENPPYANLTDEEIRSRYDDIVGMVSSLGVQYVYLWNLYGSGQQSVDLEKGVQYETDFLYQVLDGKWVIEPDNTFGAAAQQLMDNYFVSDNAPPVVSNPVEELYLYLGFDQYEIDLDVVFSDAEGDPLTYSVSSSDAGVVTATIDGTSLLLSEVGLGTSEIVLTANDGVSDSKADTFLVSVLDPDAFSISIGSNSFPSITTALAAADSGDVIDIRGIVIETVSIDKNVTLRGLDPGIDIIQASASQSTSNKRVISINRPDDPQGLMFVIIQNLGIRYGKDEQNGGGINADKVDGLLTLKNLIIEQNSTEKNGGGVSIAGSNAVISNCVIQNNQAQLDGGGVILAPNNGAGIDSQIDVYSSLIADNKGRNGGGIYINGNKDFGNDQTITVYVENSTILNNEAESGSDGAGGGGIWSKSAFWTGDNSTGNVNLRMVHSTLYNNTHSSAVKNGIQFTSTPAGALTNFSIYNSIIVTENEIEQKSINFTNANTTEAINNIFGGLNGVNENFIDADFRNNTRGKTFEYTGLFSELSEEEGQVPVLKLEEGSPAIDYCTATVDVTLPELDGRGESRDELPDAGAYENSSSNKAPYVAEPLIDISLAAGFGSEQIDLSGTFADEDGDDLVLEVEVAYDSVVTANLENNQLTLTEVAVGSSLVMVTASDGKGGLVTDDFIVTVGQNAIPVLNASFPDLVYEVGFTSDTLVIEDAFTDADGDDLNYDVSISHSDVIEAELSDTLLLISEQGSGTVLVTLSVDDGNGGEAEVSFSVTVNSDATASVSIGESSFSSINAAIAAANDGDTVEIRGIHTTSVSISKNLVLRGVNPLEDVLQAAENPSLSSSGVISISRPSDTTTGVTVTVENLGIRFGNNAENGGAINADKVDGLLTLKNLVIEQNYTAKNGGAISLAGTNAEIINCIIRENTAELDGGGLILAPNNGVGVDSDIKIISSLIDGNSSRNGGGIYINGNKDFGDDQMISVYIENSTILKNEAVSGSDASGGGAIWSKSALWTGDNSVGNVTLKMVHVTLFDNQHTSTSKNGIQFTSTDDAARTNFSLYNSIVVSADSVSEKAINFTNANTLEVINNILGGLTGADEDFIDEESRNNVKGKTASFAGIEQELTATGTTYVLRTLFDANAINYCSVDPGISLPSTDVRGVGRDSLPDAGAYEYFSDNNPPMITSSMEVLQYDEGFSWITVDVSDVFTDPDGDPLEYEASLTMDGVVSIQLTASILLITEVGQGQTQLILTALDGNGGYARDSIDVFVGSGPLSLEEQSTTKLFPNPATNYFQLTGSKEPTSVKLLTLTGKILRSYQVVPNDRYSISGVDPGIYMIQIEFNDELILTKKIIVR